MFANLKILEFYFVYFTDVRPNPRPSCSIKYHQVIYLFEEYFIYKHKTLKTEQMKRRK